MSVMRRRHPRTGKERLKEAFWPSMGMKRLLVYYKHRIFRLPGSPTAIAGGVATGVAVSLTPFFGFHLMIGTLICIVFSQSLLAMVLATIVAGNPWTFPFIWLCSYKLGRLFLWHALPAHAMVPGYLSFAVLLKQPLDLLLPMMVGCIPMVLVGWIGTFYLFKWWVVRHRAAKKRHR